MEAPEQNKAQKRRRSWRQYSISTLLIVVTVVGVGLGLVRNRAERQRRAVAAIRESGGWVRYEFEPTDGTPAELPGPDWLCRLLGVDYFAEVTIAALPNDATDETAAHLSGLTSLQTLELGSTQVGDAGLAHLGRLASLEALWLRATQVRGAGLAHLSELTSLKRLSLSNTDVGDAGLARLSHLTSLEELHLDHTQVTDAGLAHLNSLKSLRWLSLGGTQVTDAGCRRLEAALPNCRIPRWRGILPRPTGKEESVESDPPPRSIPRRQNAQGRRSKPVVSR